jgi:hypothetical protein
MRTFITALSVLLMALLVVGSVEAKAAKTKKEKPISGTIVSVAADGGSMVLQTKGKKGAAGEQKTITINPSTTIEINGFTGKHGTDLSAQMSVKVKMSGDFASDIVVGKTKHKKK